MNENLRKQNRTSIQNSWTLTRVKRNFQAQKFAYIFILICIMFLFFIPLLWMGRYTNTIFMEKMRFKCKRRTSFPRRKRNVKVCSRQMSDKIMQILFLQLNLTARLSMTYFVLFWWFFTKCSTNTYTFFI